jgi:hypothetical protein
VTEDDERPTKVCPDCAETVLAAARKCRFCGYRFDAPALDPRVRDGLLGLIVRPRLPDVPVSSVVAEWGAELDDDEDALVFVMVDVDGVPGFALVTDRRLLSFRGRGRDCSLLLDQPLSTVRSVAFERRLARNRLTVSWDGGETRFGSTRASVLTQLHDALRAVS